MSKLTKIFTIGLALCLVVATAGCKTTSKSGTTASATNFPTSTIHIVVPQAAGGSTDMVARTLQPFLTKYIGGTVVVDNVTGAGGKMGLSQVYNAKPDGYQLLLGVFPAWIITQKIDTAPDYDVLKMTPLYNISGGDYNAVVVPYDSPINSIKDLIAAGTKKSVNVAGSGLGTNSYLTYILLKNTVKANVTYIPYNSGGEAALAVVGSHVDAAVGSGISFKTLVESKKLKVIATAGPVRASIFPNVPTLEELGYKGAGYDIILGINAPPNLPAAIASKLEAALAKSVKDPEFIAAAKNANFILQPLTAANYGTAIKGTDSIVESNLKSLLAGSK
jgi:tripartite-type tricarboxylate transporter receptor subunit TctC